MNTYDKKINEIVKENAVYMKIWLKQLCDVEERLHDFEVRFLDKKCLWNSLCHYQVHLKVTGRRRDITEEELQECIDNNNDELLKLLLEDLLLIPVSKSALEIFRQCKNLKEFIKVIKEYSEMPIVDFTGDSFEIAYYQK